MAIEKHYIRDEVKNFLDGLAALNGPALTDMTLEEARLSYRALHEMTDADAQGLAVILDFECEGPRGQIPLRLYDARPHRDSGPVIMFFHGGGFVIGDLDTHHNLCTEIAHQLDLAVVAVDYRRAPEYPFPAAIEDCEAATRFIGSSPDVLNQKVSGLITIGDSAGGNASIVIGQLFASNPADVPIVLQVPIFPLVSDPQGSKSLEEFSDGFLLTASAIDYFNDAYKPNTKDSRALPILGDLDHTPPTVLVTASLDPIRDSGRDYGSALSKAGIDHIHLEVDGGTHSFVNLRKAVPSYQKDLEQVLAAVKFFLGHS